MYDYTHTPMNEEIQMPAGCYWKTEEGKMRYKNREFLFFLGNTSEVCSCCAGYVPPRRYIMVPGYIKSWEYKQNEEGLPLTEVEPVGENEAQEAIREILQAQYDITEIDFW